MSGWREASAPAKLNLALVVGPLRLDGKHEVATVIERLSLADTVAVRRASATRVTGFDDDTLVRAALEAVGRAAGGDSFFEARIEKRIPVAAGLGGGSSDAATALALANVLLDDRACARRPRGLGAALGADVPFFLYDGPQLGTGDGTTLGHVALPRDYSVSWRCPTEPSRGRRRTSTRPSTGAGARSASTNAAPRCSLPSSGVTVWRTSRACPRTTSRPRRSPPGLRALGAVRADVTGAGPMVYGLFADARDASRAASALADRAETWSTKPI